MLLEMFVGSTFAYKFCRDIAAKLMLLLNY